MIFQLGWYKYLKRCEFVRSFILRCHPFGVDVDFNVVVVVVYYFTLPFNSCCCCYCCSSFDFVCLSQFFNDI